jgi:hypothetical protein
MPEYRAYIVGQEGHFIRSVELLCTDDERAKEYAKLLVDGHHVSCGSEVGSSTSSNRNRPPDSRPRRHCIAGSRRLWLLTHARRACYPKSMRSVTPSNLANPESAARKLIEIATATEAVQDGRIHIELINLSFLRAGGSPAEYRAGIEHAMNKGWLWRHGSGVYVKFTHLGAEQFA